MNSFKKSLWLSLVIIISSTHATAMPGKILKNELTSDQASSLVNLAVRHQIRNVHPHGNFSIEPMAVQKDREFLAYEALGVWSAKQGSAVIGNYSVNIKTAEVWNIASCQKIQFPQISILQKRYRVRLGNIHNDKKLDLPSFYCQ